jgi:hypothetical protein
MVRSSTDPTIALNRRAEGYVVGACMLLSLLRKRRRPTDAEDAKDCKYEAFSAVTEAATPPGVPKIQFLVDGNAELIRACAI